MKNNEVKFGAVLSYVLIVLNAVYGLIVSPFLMSTIGASEYGVYKTIGALTASISILDLGIGGTMQRYIATYKSKNKEKSCSNFCAMGFIQGFFIMFVIACIGVGIYPTLTKVYSNSFSHEEMLLAKQLFVLSMVHIIIHIQENVISGIIIGHNRFIFHNSVRIINLATRIILCYILLPIVKSAKLLILLTIVLEIIVMSVQLVYIRVKIKLKIKLYKFDLTIFKESFIYTLFVFLQSITDQVNSNLDNVIIGAILGAKKVAIYSFGILIFSMFQSISTAISGVMLPTITNQLNSELGMESVEKTIIKTGTIQFFLLGSCLCGFVLFGKEFIALWLGPGFSDIWIITMILIIPAIFELSINVCISVLRAKNKMGFRTIALLIGTILNFFVSYFGVKKYGYFAAAFGTAFSIVFSNLILMNIYYVKKIKINIIKIYYSIFRATIPILTITLLVVSCLIRFVNVEGWFGFIVKGLSFCVVELLCYVGLCKIKKKNILNNE